MSSAGGFVAGFACGTTALALAFLALALVMAGRS